LLAKLCVDLVVIRCANARVADALDPTADADTALWTGHEVVEAINDKRKQCSHAERADADANPPAGIAMHQIANQKSCGRSKQGRCGKRAGFNPHGF